MATLHTLVSFDGDDSADDRTSIVENMESGTPATEAGLPSRPRAPRRVSTTFF